MIQLYHNEETIVTKNTVDSYFNSDYITPNDLGLRFAFAITAYDSRENSTLTPEIG